MRYGYYLAKIGACFGDPELASACYERWSALGHPNPERYDGCSAWIEDCDGVPSVLQINIRLLARDLFSEKFRVCQAMVRL